MWPNHHLETKFVPNHRYFSFENWVCQNISKKILLKGAQFRAKILSGSGDFVQRKEQMHIPPLRAKMIGHKMCTILDAKKSNFGS